MSPVLLLDSSVLIAYEQELTRRAQALVMEAMTDGRIVASAAVSLAVACAELAGTTPELSWLVYDHDSPLTVLPLASNAMEVGALAAGADLEVAQVAHEAAAASAVVFTYQPARYEGRGLDVVDMRP